MPQSTDNVDARLTPHEAVLNRNAAELVGRQRIAHINAMGNAMAQRGIDLPTIHAQYGNEDVTMNNPRYYQTGIEDVDPGPGVLKRLQLAYELMREPRWTTPARDLIMNRPTREGGLMHLEHIPISDRELEARTRMGQTAPSYTDEMRGYQGGTDDVAAYEAQQLAAHQGALGALDYIRGDPASEMQRRAAMQTIEKLNDGNYDWFGTGSPSRDRYFMQGRKSAYDVGEDRQYQPYGLSVSPRYQGGTSDVFQLGGALSGNDPLQTAPGAGISNDPYQPAGSITSNDPSFGANDEGFYAGKYFGGGLVPHGHGMFGGGMGGFRGHGGGGRNMSMFQEGTEDVFRNPIGYEDGTSDVYNPWEPATDPNDPRLSNIPLNAAPPAPPAPATTPATAAARRWTPEQQKIVDQIYSGREDYTFGPGSPNPTKEDLQTYVGSPRYAPAGGFQQERGVALPAKKYNLFTPEQRRELGIMDIAPDNQEGIERWYGTPGAWAGTGDPQYANPRQGSFATVQNGVYSMDPSGDYAKATAGAGTGTDAGGPSKFGEGVGVFGKAISGLAQGFAKSADEDTKRATSQALSLVSGPGNPYNQVDPLAAYYAALRDPTTFRR